MRASGYSSGSDPTMPASDEDPVLTLVESALTYPKDQREHYLRGACGDNPGLFAQAWSYLQAEEHMDGFLADPLFSIFEREPLLRPGDVLSDRFHIVNEVAQGGMGIVYMAIDEKLNRRIAIKCAKAGFRQRLPPEVRNA